MHTFDDCLLCHQESKTADHLLITCPVANEVSWARCSCNFVPPTITDWWEHPVDLQGAKQKVSTLFMLAPWSLGTSGENAMLALVCSIVRRSAPVSVILDRIKTDVSLWIEAGVRQLGNRLFFLVIPMPCRTLACYVTNNNFFT
jgi:hypothetical protein